MSIKERIDSDLRIATWNLERPQSVNEPRVAVQRERLKKINADVWILTEAHDQVSPGDKYEAIHSRKIPEGVYDGEHRTIIWSRFPVRKIIPTHDPESAVCVELETPMGDFLVYGTVLPYQHAATQGMSYYSGGMKVKGRKGWELHYESIQRHQADLKTLIERHPTHHICFGGDLNQSRDGKVWPWGRQWYGTHHGRTLLTDCLEQSGLNCVTERDFNETGQLPSKSSVDHLCVSNSLTKHVVHVDAWQADCLKGKPVSDHNGVCVDLSIVRR
ncbi:endonuclease/exonuclease/phosphatase family protein [Thalassoglobus sp.]|uniref:endonuclease/exonuclease/phosphatase family protein n=1 Tax=Thalassoglobus sp. TaxID=2795869 RepID=UPI003AA7CFF2